MCDMDSIPLAEHYWPGAPTGRLTPIPRVESDLVNHPGATGSLGVGEACGNKIPGRAARFSQPSLVAKPGVTI